MTNLINENIDKNKYNNIKNNNTILTLREKLSKIYEELENKSLKTKEANFGFGRARIYYFRG